MNHTTTPPPQFALADTPRFGAFVADVAWFDAAAFGISTTEAVLLDPQQRLLLEAATEALLASRAASSQGKADCLGDGWATFVGMASSDYGSLVHSFIAPGAFHATSNALSVASGRIAYTLGLTGPAVSVDTACSASLVALHAARRELAVVGGAAVVGGVHIQATATSSNYVWTAGETHTSRASIAGLSWPKLAFCAIRYIRLYQHPVWPFPSSTHSTAMSAG